MGCHFLLQEIFPTQGLNPGLQHCRQTPHYLSYQGSPNVSKGLGQFLSQRPIHYFSQVPGAQVLPLEVIIGNAHLFYKGAFFPPSNLPTELTSVCSIKTTLSILNALQG